jgi:hypothetical protein
VAQRFTAATTGLFLGPALQIVEKLGFVSGHRFSDAENPPKSVAPLGAGLRKFTLSAICLAAEVTPRRRNNRKNPKTHAVCGIEKLAARAWNSACVDSLQGYW